MQAKNTQKAEHKLAVANRRAIFSAIDLRVQMFQYFVKTRGSTPSLGNELFCLGRAEEPGKAVLASACFRLSPSNGFRLNGDLQLRPSCPTANQFAYYTWRYVSIIEQL